MKLTTAQRKLLQRINDVSSSGGYGSGGLFHETADAQRLMGDDLARMRNGALIITQKGQRILQDVPKPKAKPRGERELVVMMLQHLSYSFNDIEWDFDSLTDEEQAIFGDQATLDQLRKLADKAGK